MSKKQENSLILLETQIVRHREYSGETYNKISLYAWDEPLKDEDASLLVAECKKLFNIDSLKAKYFLMRVLQKGWSKQQFEDAIANAFDTNKIPTKNVGMEPGVILSYEKEIKLYDYHESVNCDHPLIHVEIKGLSGHWWVNNIDYTELDRRGVLKPKKNQLSPTMVKE